MSYMLQQGVWCLLSCAPVVQGKPPWSKGKGAACVYCPATPPGRMHASDEDSGHSVSDVKSG